ncbi:ABC transporter permease [Georgenia yuyongxinii]|uniref:ABC transporter permease n=1 Tax=Georgenia yuyongxinii TaxID=2589797 RepID=A0A552WKR8_9MICO|nr:ABC transporter permease [Georgenia yuyongxinii]TRW43348.1 ABC transporter permease [Georgenia yuyongxinii]
MSRLTKVELRRLFSRRLVVLAMLAGLVATVAALVGTWNQSQPMSPSEQAQAERWYQEARADWEANGEQHVADCLEAEETEREATGQVVDFGCRQMEPARDMFIVTAPPFESSLPGLLGAQSSLLLFLALLVGAAATAAELSTGSIASWLTFEPRRLHVYASKLLAPGLGLLPVAVTLLALLVAGAWFIAGAFDLTGTMTGAAWADAGWTVLRVLALTLLAAVVGAALGFLLQHTAAVLGVVVGYVIVVEAMFRGLLQDHQRWLLSTNIGAWIENGTVYFQEVCTAEAAGTVCAVAERSLGFDGGAAYLLVLVTALVVLAALVFRRRDVV